jgi:hypothetical protein
MGAALGLVRLTASSKSGEILAAECMQGPLLLHWHIHVKSQKEAWQELKKQVGFIFDFNPVSWLAQVPE